MNDFYSRLKAGLAMGSEEKKAELIELFRENRYREPVKAIVSLIVLRQYLNNPLEADYHLFNHYLSCSISDMAVKSIPVLVEHIDAVSDLMNEFPLQCDNGNMLASYMKQGDIESAREMIAGSNRDCSRQCYEIADMLIEIDKNASAAFMKRAISGDMKQNTYLILLYMKHYIQAYGIESAYALMTERISMDNIDNNAVKYRFAVLFEDIAPSKAVSLYRDIIKSGTQYLDTEERINKLTKNKNGYNINDTDESNDNIVF